MTAKEYKALWYQRNKEKVLKQSKAYYEGNKGKVLGRHKKWRDNHKAYQAEYDKNWREQNRGKARAKVRGYQAKKLRALPAWADKKAIVAFYSNCPDGFEVDHIVPIQGKIVCGLHVLENLQYLPINVNRSKSNKF